MKQLTENSDLFTLMDTESDQVIAEKVKVVGSLQLRTFNRKGISILHKAAQIGYVKTIEAICNNIAQEEVYSLINLRDNGGCNVLHIAAENGHTEVVKLLLEKNPQLILEMTARNTGYADDNVLHIAAACGHTEIVKLLLEKDPQLVHIKNSFEENVLFIAAQDEETEVVKFLLDLEEAPELINSTSCGDDHALFVAVDHGSTEIAKLVLEKGPDLDVIYTSSESYEGCNVVEYMFSGNSNYLYSSDYKPNTLKEEGQEIIELLIAKYPQLMSKINKEGLNTLDYAISIRNDWFIKLLLEKDPSLLIRATTNNRKNVVDRAVESRDPKMMEIVFRADPAYCMSFFKNGFLPQGNFTPNDYKEWACRLVPAFFESEIYKEEPTKRLFCFLQMLASLKDPNTKIDESLLVQYEKEIQNLVDNERCVRNEIIENGKTLLEFASDLGIDDYLLKTKEINLLDFIKCARPDLEALPYIQSQNINAGNDMRIKENVAARYTDPYYDFHPKVRKEVLALTKCREWKLGRSPFQELTQDKLENIRLFLCFASKLEMSLVLQQVQSDWAKESLSSKQQKRITDFFCRDGDKQEGKREREGEDLIQESREHKRQKK